MLNRVEIYTERGLVLTLPLLGSDDGYIVDEIEGLDPNKASVISSDLALMDGELFQTARGEKRNIIFKLSYQLGHATSVLVRRNKLYNFFMPKMRITMRFYVDGLPPVYINGVVESCVAPMFVKDPKATISILCHKPEFVALDVVELAGATTSTPTAATVTYEGSLETGFEFSMLVNRALTNFTIHHNLANGVGGSIPFSGSLLSGDLIEISTVSGNKGAWLTRAGVERSVLYAVAPQAQYIQLQPGENSLRVYAEGALIPYTIKYREKFGGL